MAFPTTDYATGKQNCPKGWVHVPHLFYEMYWDTQVFKDRWTPGQGSQPFLLSNGDLTGCSGHGDFLAAWDPATLTNIIDNCNAGDAGMNLCPGITLTPETPCRAASPIDEVITGNLTALPGANALTGWGLSYGGGPLEPAASSAASDYIVVIPTVIAIVDDGGATPDSPPSTPTAAQTSQCIPRTVTVTVTATQTATKETPTAYAAVKRDDHAHAHAHAHVHAARHGGPHHGL